MTWFSLSILAAVLLATVTIIDKEMVGKLFKDAPMYSLFIMIHAFVAATFFVWIEGSWELLHMRDFLLTLVSGIFMMTGTMLYFYSLQHENASLVASLALTRPLLALIWSTLFLGEALYWLNIIGVFIIVTGTFVLTFEKDEVLTRYKFNRALPIMVFSSLLHSLADLLIKIAVDDSDSTNIFFWQMLGALLTAATFVIVLPVVRQRLWKMLTSVPAIAYVPNIGNEFLANLAGLMVVGALSIGNLGLVVTLRSTQPLYIISIAFVINWFFPGFLTPEISAKTLLPRWVAILMIVGGIYLISI